MVEAVHCEQCGAETKHPVTKTIDGRVLNFCCAGCLGVYELLREEGLRPGQRARGTPAGSHTAQASSNDLQAQGVAPSETISLRIVGMTCANCVAHVEQGLLSVAGVLAVSVDLATGGARVEMIPGAATMAGLRQAVENVGYAVVDLGDSEEGRAGREQAHGIGSKLAGIWKRGPGGGRRPL